ncbi:unnamed protein product [Brassica rapa subsp. narinosa]
MIFLDVYCIVKLISVLVKRFTTILIFITISLTVKKIIAFCVPMDGTLPVKVPGNQGDDATSVSWYLSRQEIETNSPSRRDGIGLKKEIRLRKSYCTFLKNLGVRLKVPQITIATAIVFCHRFFLRQSHAKNDRWTIATACMFLAGKAEETPRVLQDVAIVSYEIIHKKDVPAAQRKEVCEQQKKSVLSAEELLLSTLNFDLSVGHPYEPLIDAIKKYKVEEVKAQFPQVAWSFVNDCYGTTLCLQYKPRQIAAGAFFLAAEHLTVDLKSYGEGLFQEFDISPGQLEDIRGQMLELYEKKHVSTTQGSIVEGSNGGDIVHQTVSKEVDSADKCPSSDTGGDPSKANLSQSNDQIVHDDVSRPEGIEKDNSKIEAGENQDGHSIDEDSQLRAEEVEGEGDKDKKSSEEEGIKQDLSEREVEDVELRDEDDKTVEMGSQCSLIATPVRLF